MRAHLALIVVLLFFAVISAGGQVTENGSLLYYLTCDGLPAADSSPLARPNATTIGNPEVVPGIVGNAFRLNTGASSTVTDEFFAGTWEPHDPLTVTAWFQIDDADANNFMKIISTKISDTDPKGFEVQYNPAEKTWTLLGSGPTFATSRAVTVNANTWYHVAMVASGANGTIYLNGEDVTGSAALSPVQANPGKEVVVGGSATLTTVNEGGVWRGLLDEVRVYSVPLTAAQVQAIIAEANVTINSTSTTTVATTATTATSSLTSTISTAVSTSTSTVATVATSASASVTTRAATTGISPLGNAAPRIIAPLALLLIVLVLAVLIQ